MEKDIIHSINYEQLAQEIKNKKESSPEFSSLPAKEAVRHVLQDKGLPPPSTQTFQKTLASDALEYAGEIPPEASQKARFLLALTLENGLEKGIAEAKKADPFILDLYHDTLQETLLRELGERNLL